MYTSDANPEVNLIMKCSERPDGVPKEPGPPARAHGELHCRQRVFFRFGRIPYYLVTPALASTSQRILGSRTGVHKKQREPFTRIECAT